jgi:protein TonB
MFEDATFESTGKIRTRSTRWMLATFALNGSILAAMILVPLIYPAAIPRFNPITLIEAPTTPAELPKPVHVPAGAVAVRVSLDPTFTAPTRIPKIIDIPGLPDVAVPAGDWDRVADNGNGSPDNPFNVQHRVTVVQEKPKAPTPVSSGVMLGLLVHKVVPNYPAIPKAAHIEGSVVLEATISKTGRIENLHVVSGSAMFNQAAMDAVAQWAYQPYLLNGEPVEVETTVNVVFKLN